MECMPLDVPKWGRRCEYGDINVHDVVMLEIPWLCVVADGSILAYGIFLLNPTLLNPFTLPKHTPQTPPNSHLWHRQWLKTPHYTLGRKQIANWPPKLWSARGFTWSGQLDTMANMMILPFLKSAAVWWSDPWPDPWLRQSHTISWPHNRTRHHNRIASMSS